MKALILLFTLLVGIGYAETRHALIMGVWNYEDPTFPPLPELGIRADIDGMNARLTTLGFTVTVVQNPSLKQAKDAVDSFGRTISEQPGTALFYFTGHGSEYDGKNFLIPAGTAITENGDLDTEALAADRVLARLEKNPRFANIVFLDCCRNSLSKSGGTGMAAMEAKGTFIGYATATTKTSQATANGSYYTNALVKYLGTPGLSITDMHTKVTREVKLRDRTQNPFQYSGLDDIFFFVPDGMKGDDEFDRLRMDSETLNRSAKIQPSAPTMPSAGGLQLNPFSSAVESLAFINDENDTSFNSETRFSTKAGSYHYTLYFAFQANRSDTDKLVVTQRRDAQKLADELRDESVDSAVVIKSANQGLEGAAPTMLGTDFEWRLHNGKPFAMLIIYGVQIGDWAEGKVHYEQHLGVFDLRNGNQVADFKLDTKAPAQLLEEAREAADKAYFKE